jgi:hypothetical protein
MSQQIMQAPAVDDGNGNDDSVFESKRLVNPIGNRLNQANCKVKISPDGLKANSNEKNGWQYVFAEQAFCISGEKFWTDNFPGTIMYYFEVMEMIPYNWSVFLFYNKFK